MWAYFLLIWGLGVVEFAFNLTHYAQRIHVVGVHFVLKMSHAGPQGKKTNHEDLQTGREASPYNAASGSKQRKIEEPTDKLELARWPESCYEKT